MNLIEKLGAYTVIFVPATWLLYGAFILARIQELGA